MARQPPDICMRSRLRGNIISSNTLPAEPSDSFLAAENMVYNECHMLALPTEILQQISRFVTVTDLLTLRLTCKELSTAAFDAFANEYFSTLTCFFLDPNRLTRLDALTACPGFAEKVQVIWLTGDPSERQQPSSTHTVEAAGQTLSVAQNEMYYEYNEKQIDLYSKKKPDLMPLSAVLGRLYRTRSQLRIDLTRMRAKDESEGYMYIGHDILDAISIAKFPISSLLMTDLNLGRLKPLLKKGSALDTSIKGLKHLTYYAEEDSLNEEISSNMSAVPRILSTAQQLTHMDVELFHSFGYPGVVRALVDFSTDLVLASSTNALRKVHLTCVRISGFQTIFQALGSWYATLQELKFDEICIETSRNRWKELLQYLQTFPALHRLYLDYLSQGFEHGDFSVIVPEIGDEDDKIFWTQIRINEVGTKKVHAALAKTADQGLELRAIPSD